MQFDIWRESTFSSVLQHVLCIKVLLSSFLVLLSVIYFKKQKKTNKPPTCKGWIPFLGCAIEFGKSPLSYIGKKKAELGPIFAVYLGGETLNFLIDPRGYHDFFESSNLDFIETASDATFRTADIPKSSLKERLRYLHNTVKGKVAPARVVPLASSICDQYDTQFQCHMKCGVEIDLFYTLKRLMYAPIAHTLYRNNGFGFEDKDTYEQFIHQFEIFDGDFEMGVKLPSIFIRRWLKAKKYMLNLVTNVCSIEDTHDVVTLLDELKQAVTNGEAPNYTVMVMLASLANVVPVAFWTLARVLTDERIEKKLRQELETVLADKIAEGDFNITGEDIQNLPYLKCCVQEALRLSSEGVVGRRVIKDFKLLGYDIKAGEMMLVSPYWAHRDAEVYPEPETFRPERWEDVNIDTLSYRKGFLVFGGGKWQCPGRHFGYMVMQSFVASFLLRYNCQVHHTVPPASTRHLVGIQHPDSPFNVTCTPRTYYSH